MGERVVTRSENARHVILKYGDILYHVDQVDVQYSERKKMYEAVFRAKTLGNSQSFDLDFEISPNIYQVLVDYAKLDNSDLLLVLHFDGKIVKWRLVSEKWLQQQIESKISKYVV